MDTYINNKTNVLSPSTIRGYRNIRNNQLQAVVDLPLGRLTQAHVQEAVNDDAETHTPKTVRNAHGFLSSVLVEQGIAWSLNTKLPAKVKKIITVPEHDDVKLFLAATSNPRLIACILLAAILGLRRSEICALTWDDYQEGKLTVNKAMVMNEHGKWVVKAPKSYAGTRTLEVPGFVAERINALPRCGEHILPIVPTTITGAFYDLNKRLGTKVRYHDLRHYNASVMLALGVPDKYAMERIGDATEHMFKAVYQHVMRDKQQQVATLVTGHFTNIYDTKSATTPKK